MYNDMYNVYSDQCLVYDYPISFKKRNRCYLYLNDPINVQWYYTDEVNLRYFIIDRDETDPETVPEYLENKQIIISFYNFRKELVHQVTFDNSQVQHDEDSYFIDYTIDSKLSTDVFIRGIYYCGAQLLDENENLETILYYENCSMRVM